MKRILVTIGMILALFTANAQTEKFEITGGLKTVNIKGISNLSLVQDNTNRYNTVAQYIHFGYRTGRHLFGIEVDALRQIKIANLSDESNRINAFAFKYRLYEQLNERVDVFFGAKLGMAGTTTYNMGSDNTTRWNAMYAIEVGLNYNVSKHVSFGIFAEIFSAIGLGSTPTVPAGYTPNRASGFNGYCIGQGLTIRF